MYRYSSNITFIYYNSLEYGSFFMENVLDLELIMDQGFAKVYRVNETSFVGIVQLTKATEYKGNTLLSLNTSDCLKEYKRVSKLECYSLTDIQRLDQIPLDSFFFKDEEGHDFEIQQFLSEKDQLMF